MQRRIDEREALYYYLLPLAGSTPRGCIRYADTNLRNMKSSKQASTCVPSRQADLHQRKAKPKIDDLSDMYNSPFSQTSSLNISEDWASRNGIIKVLGTLAKKKIPHCIPQGFHFRTNMNLQDSSISSPKCLVQSEVGDHFLDPSWSVVSRDEDSKHLSELLRTVRIA